jgi:hypothetical protein
MEEKNDEKIVVACKIAGIIAGYGANKVVMDIFDSTLPPVEGRFDKIVRWIGVKAIAGAVAVMADKYARDFVVDTAVSIDLVRSAWDETKSILDEHKAKDEADNARKIDISNAMNDLADKIVEMAETYEEGDEQNDTKEEIFDGGKNIAGESDSE